MPIDPYSLCPGGSGKKIKFCCGDLIDDLNRFDKMVEGEQFVAAVEQIDVLLETHANNEALLALKTRLLRTLGRLDEAKAAATVFVDSHPKNPVALAESAIIAALEGDGRGGMARLQAAFAVSSKELYGRVYEAMGAVAAALLHEGEVCACRSLLQLQMMIAKDDREPLDMLVRINGSPSIPLFFKQDYPWAECPDGAAWKSRFDEAMSPVKQGHWSEAADRLSDLAAELSDEPALWRNLSIIRDWLADADGCVEALRNLSALDISYDDAVEAEALALLRSEEGFGDEYDLLELDYEIKSADELAATFSTCDRAQQVPVNYDPIDENDVPPKSSFVLVDRSSPESADNLDPGEIPQVIGQAMLFGRQTNRPARLSISGVSSTNLDSLEAFIADTCGDQIVGQPEQKTIAQRSATQDLLRRPWYLPRNVTQSQLRDLMHRHTQDALLRQWPQMSLGCLDGKTPADAAADTNLQRRLAALVLVLETTIDSSDGDFDFNRLRDELGLPKAEQIDPGEDTDIVETLPLVRLARIEAEKLPDDALRNGYSRAAAFYADKAVRRFGEEILNRDSLKGSDVEIDVLNRLCHMETDVDKRFAYVQRGRDNSKANGQSCAMWDLLELPIRLERNEPEEMGRLVQHLQSEHINEPGVADALVQFLMQIGAIRPDGMPAAEQEPSAAEPETGKLWTPDGESAGGEKPSLWTPGMD